jgi:DNA-binding NarL/FixJ family response regulator
MDTLIDDPMDTTGGQANHKGLRLGNGNTNRKIILVENNLLRRECLAQLLAAHAGDFDVESVAHVAMALTHDPHLVVLDLKSERIGDAWSREQLGEIRRRFDDVPVVAIADQGGIQFAVEAIRHGLRGYVPTSLGIGIAVAAIHLVLAGGIYVPSEMVDYVSGTKTDRDEARPDRAPAEESCFTSRESEILELIRQGKPNKIIAHALDISESTVKVHMRNIMRKLRATNRTQVAFLTREQFPAIFLFGHALASLGLC